MPSLKCTTIIMNGNMFHFWFKSCERCCISLYIKSFIMNYNILAFFKDHLAQCHPYPSCEYCGKTFDSANNLNLHKLNECDKITVPCDLKDYGCSSSVCDKE